MDEIVEIMLETVCTARKTIRIAGDDYPAELVKSKFMKLNSSHVEFVLDCMRENTTKVRNIKQYLKAVPACPHSKSLPDPHRLQPPGSPSDPYKSPVHSTVQ